MAHAGRFLELERAGACLGLHLHPYKYDPARFRAHFGGLSADAQRKTRSETVAIWAAALGRRPTLFRPGTFSANDGTYQVLADLGFTGGSVSCPGRVLPELNAVWAGAVADPHRAHATFRMLAGDLDFADLPLSVDFSDRGFRDGRGSPRDLRPDYRDADHERIAANIVGQIRGRAPAVPIMMLVTHNDNDYSNPADRVGRNFRRVLDAIGAACRAAGMAPVGTTVERVCDAVRALPPSAGDWKVGHGALLTG